jgi:TonB-dependent SusC/RagA subfamily outer membrane receptor
MKAKVLITALVLSANILGAYSQEDLLSKLSDNQNITTVTITKALLDMAPALISNSVEGFEINKLINKLDQIDICKSENKEACRQMKILIENNVAKNKTYETLMRIKDKTDHVTFYAEKENKNFKSLIMLVEETGECTLIRIKGNFTARDIQEVIKKDTSKPSQYGGYVVTRNELEKTGETNLLKAIAMKVPGVKYMPGNLQIRGISTLNSTTSPIYIVDGVETSYFSHLLVSEIDYVEVLKDQSTAMFGMRGANGVVVINRIK